MEVIIPALLLTIYFIIANEVSVEPHVAIFNL